MGKHSGKIARRAQLWTTARALKEFTAKDLSSHSKMSVQYVHRAFMDWRKWGYIEEAGKRGHKTIYRALKTDGTPPVTDDDGNRLVDSTPADRMWFAMRKSNAFNYRDIAMHANSEDTPVSEEQAQAYCRMLANAGYLHVLQKSNAAGKLAIYRLARDTGPRPPRERRVRAVYDDNLGEFTHIAGGLANG